MARRHLLPVGRTAAAARRRRRGGPPAHDCRATTGGTQLPVARCRDELCCCLSVLYESGDKEKGLRCFFLGQPALMHQLTGRITWMDCLLISDGFVLGMIIHDAKDTDSMCSGRSDNHRIASMHDET